MSYLWFQRFLASVDGSTDHLAHRAERRAEHLARDASVRHLYLLRLTPEVVQRHGTLDVTSTFGHLGVCDGVDGDDRNETQYREHHYLSYRLEHLHFSLRSAVSVNAA